MRSILHAVWSILYTFTLHNVGPYIHLSEGKPQVRDESFENNLAIQFGRNIRAARAKRSMKQEDLCDKANIDRSYLSKLESGSYNITLPKVYALAVALECPLSEILPEINGVKIK
jgi:ribosome-binding protein aMBF1 (putative translation factor)